MGVEESLRGWAVSQTCVLEIPASKTDVQSPQNNVRLKLSWKIGARDFVGGFAPGSIYFRRDDGNREGSNRTVCVRDWREAA
jgi:hypothetical protein